MQIRSAALSLLVLMAACTDAPEASARPVAHHADPSKWTIGPIIQGRNYSPGMPLHPAQSREGGLQIELPRAPASLHYVTFPHGPLTEKSRIVMHYRIEADPGVRIVPTTAPSSPSLITLYFQRGGDNWTGRRAFESYRWYATFATKSDVKPGQYVMVAPLNANWTAVQASTAATAPGAYRAAIANADQVGFVLGGGDGFGHGVHIEGRGRARLIVTDFRIE